MQVYYIFKALLLIFFTVKSTEETKLGSSPTKAIQIEINKGHSKPTTFTIIATRTFQDEVENIKLNLERSKRFIYVQDKTKSERLILVKQEPNGQISVEIIDNVQHQSLRKFLMKQLNNDTQLIACNEIYQVLTHEKGIFKDKLILTIYTKKNTCELYSINSNLTNLEKICDNKVQNLLDLFLCDNKIFLSKYTKKDQAFSILYFDPESKTFYNVFTIQGTAVYAPVVYDREIYVAVTDHATTGIFKRPFTGSKTYTSFSAFMKDPTVITVTNVPGRIATAPTVNQGKIAFCADFNGRPSIYLYPNKRISSDEGSYFDPSINNNNLAAIKILQGQFNLVLINLKNGIEKTLLTKYYIARPTWSPCGNWIAVSCRDKDCKDIILLIHKTGKYTMKIQTNHKIKNIIWMKGQ